MTRFECQRCGDCCRNLLITLQGNYHVGLLLLPEELKLFPINSVSPMWAVNTKGRRRPGRPKTIFYQLNRNTCPHITKENTCRIYKHRPQVCRGYPLTIHVNATASLDQRCKGCHKAQLYNIEGELRKIFSKEIIGAQIVLHRSMAKGFGVDYSKVFLFDLLTKEWKTLAYDDLKAMGA